MVAVIIAVLIVFVVVGLLLRYAPPPGEVARRQSKRSIAVERLCATLQAADENPMYVIPPAAMRIVHEITDSKELNP